MQKLTKENIEHAILESRRVEGGLRPRLGAAAVGLQVAMRKIFFETHKIFFEMCKQI